MENPYAIIQSMYPTFTKVSRKIADYIFADPNRILDISIQEMARELEIAESSIVRFCKIIGSSGFSETKLYLAKYISYTASVFENLKEGDSVEHITRSVFARNIATLQKAVEILDFERIERASKIINSAKNIIICGIGSSASIADSFAIHLIRIGMPARSITDSELLQISARQSNKDTVFIAISKTGRNLPIVKAFEIAKAAGAQTICLTCYAYTPLEKFSDVCIIHYYPTESLVSTRVVQNTIIDCLYIIATNSRREEVINTLIENRQVVSPLRL